MNIRLLRNDTDLQKALTRLEELWGAEVGTVEGNELELLASVIERYEDEYYPMPPPHPLAAIRLRVERQGVNSAGIKLISDDS